MRSVCCGTETFEHLAAQAAAYVKNSCLDHAKSGPEFRQSLTKATGDTNRLSRSNISTPAWTKLSGKSRSGAAKGRTEDSRRGREVAARSKIPRLRQVSSIQCNLVYQFACVTDQRSQSTLLDPLALGKSPGFSGSAMRLLSRRFGNEARNKWLFEIARFPHLVDGALSDYRRFTHAPGSLATKT